MRFCLPFYVLLLAGWRGVVLVRGALCGLEDLARGCRVPFVGI